MWVVLIYDTSSVLLNPGQETLQILENLTLFIYFFCIFLMHYIFFYHCLKTFLNTIPSAWGWNTKFVFLFLSIRTRGLHVTWTSAPWLCQPWIGASSPLVPTGGGCYFLIKIWKYIHKSKFYIVLERSTLDILWIGRTREVMGVLIRALI